MTTTTDIGRGFEDVACLYLIAQGYRIVARNYRVQGGEIDIIAHDGDVLCFVEVRGRAEDEHGTPFETIDARKMSRIIHAAREYLQTLDQAWPPMRFDAVGIVGDAPAELIRGAFEDTRIGASTRVFT